MGALYFFNGHFLSNAHPCHIECRDLQGDGTVALFSVDAAFNYMKAQFFGDWDSASRILASESPAEASSLVVQSVVISLRRMDGIVGLTRRQCCWHYRRSFCRGGGLASELAETGQCPLALASQADLVWGIGCSVLEAELGMVWVGQNLLGELLQDSPARAGRAAQAQEGGGRANVRLLTTVPN